MSKMPNKGKVIRATIDDTELDNLKEVVKTALQCNIAIKKFQLNHADKQEYVDMMNKSIENSNYALGRVDEIENVETINMPIVRAIGEKNWKIFIQILGVFSGSFGDPMCYESDKKITKAKQEQE